MAINPNAITTDKLNEKLTGLVNGIDIEGLGKSLDTVSQKWKAYDLTEFGKGFGEIKGGFAGLTEATNNLTEQLAGQLDQNGFPCGGVNEATITRLTDTVKDTIPGFKTALTNHSAAIGNLISSAHALSVDSAAIDIHAVVPESFAVDIHDAGLLNDIITDGSAEAIAAHYKVKGGVEPSAIKDLLGETAHADVKDIVDIAANELTDQKLPADLGLSIKLGGDQLSKALGGLDGGNLMKAAVESFTGGIGNAISSIAEGMDLDLSAIPQINPGIDLKAGLGSAIAGVENIKGIKGNVAATAGNVIGAIGSNPAINIGGAGLTARDIAEATTGQLTSGLGNALGGSFAGVANLPTPSEIVGGVIPDVSSIVPGVAGGLAGGLTGGVQGAINGALGNITGSLGSAISGISIDIGGLGSGVFAAIKPPLSLASLALPGAGKLPIPDVGGLAGNLASSLTGNLSGALPGLDKLNKIDLTNLMLAGKNTDVADLLSSQIKIPGELKQAMTDLGESIDFKSPKDVQGFIDRAKGNPGLDPAQILEMEGRLKQLDDNIVNLDTCTTKTIKPGGQSNQMPVTDPGEYTRSSGSSKFPFINSQEELIRYLQSATREITTVIWHWTANYTNQGHIGSEQIDKIHKNRGFNEIGYHFIIKRDGSLQVGRGINKTGAHVKGFNTGSVGISFVAGYKCSSDKYAGVPPHSEVGKESITQAQQATMFRFMKAWYTVFPGGQAWGHADFPRNKGKVDPGFSVANYVKTAFDKRNIGDPRVDDKILSSSQIASRTNATPTSPKDLEVATPPKPTPKQNDAPVNESTGEDGELQEIQDEALDDMPPNEPFDQDEQNLKDAMSPEGKELIEGKPYSYSAMYMAESYMQDPAFGKEFIRAEVAMGPKGQFGPEEIAYFKEKGIL